MHLQHAMQKRRLGRTGLVCQSLMQYTVIQIARQPDMGDLKNLYPDVAL